MGKFHDIGAKIDRYHKNTKERDALILKNQSSIQLKKHSVEKVSTNLTVMTAALSEIQKETDFMISSNNRDKEILLGLRFELDELTDLVACSNSVIFS